MISKAKIFVFMGLIGMSCSHTQKVGDLINQNEVWDELNALEEIDLSDKKKFNNFLQVIKRELHLVKKGTDIPYSIWDKIGHQTRCPAYCHYGFFWGSGLF